MNAQIPKETQNRNKNIKDIVSEREKKKEQPRTRVQFRDYLTLEPETPDERNTSFASQKCCSLPWPSIEVPRVCPCRVPKKTNIMMRCPKTIKPGRVKRSAKKLRGWPKDVLTSRCPVAKPPTRGYRAPTAWDAHP
ncbi:hypothetical protein VTH06DRAFT_6147 [Thermothelomyces fergusii]